MVSRASEASLGKLFPLAASCTRSTDSETAPLELCANASATTSFNSHEVEGVVSLSCNQPTKAVRQFSTDVPV